MRAVALLVVVDTDGVHELIDNPVRAARCRAGQVEVGPGGIIR